MGFGDGAEGTAGNFYQLLVTIFVELFGVTLGQLAAAISPSIQVIYPVQFCLMHTR